jgi:hypothetical protein
MSKFLKSKKENPVIIYLSLLVAIVGALIYALSSNAKFAELGRLAFAAGLVVFLFKIGPDVLHVLQ